MLCIRFHIFWIGFMHIDMINLVARTHSYMMDILCALSIVFPSVACVCSFCMYNIPETPWSTWIASCLQLRPTTSPSTTTVSMVMRISIRGRIFPKGGEMMRSILWTSPCQESVWQVTRASETSTSHTQR